MKIMPKGNGVFEFCFEENERQWVLQGDSYEETKELFLKSISMTVDRELQRMFAEFNKMYYTNLDKKDI